MKHFFLLCMLCPFILSISIASTSDNLTFILKEQTNELETSCKLNILGNIVCRSTKQSSLNVNFAEKFPNTYFHKMVLGKNFICGISVSHQMRCHVADDINLPLLPLSYDDIVDIRLRSEELVGNQVDGTVIRWSTLVHYPTPGNINTGGCFFE